MQRRRRRGQGTLLQQGRAGRRSRRRSQEVVMKRGSSSCSSSSCSRRACRSGSSGSRLLAQSPDTRSTRGDRITKMLLLLRIIMRLQRAKRPHAVEEIGPWIVDRHARVVRILSPTLSGRRAQIIPDLPLLLLLLWIPGMACIVHRLEFGPLIPWAKRTACHRQRCIHLAPTFGLA